MSFSVLALQYARLGEGDKAYELFIAKLPSQPATSVRCTF